MTQPSSHPSADQRCACVSSDARHCYCLRYNIGIDEEEREDYCECICHDDAEDEDYERA